MNRYMGIDIGGTKIAFGLFDEKRELQYKEQAMTDAEMEGEAFFSQIAAKIRQFYAEIAQQGDHLQGVGIGITGFVDFDKGALSKTASLPKLNDFPVVEYLKEKVGYDITIMMDNDCHCGALAEYRRGAGIGHRHMLYCPVSTGISTGIIIDGKLFRGSNGASGESGHMLLDVQGEARIDCSCGNAACFNSLGSGKAITQHVRRWLSQGERSILPDMAGSIDDINAKHISGAHDLGDPIAIRAVEQMAHYLALWIFDVYMLLNIDCIVFSGGLLGMGEKLFGRILADFDRYHSNGFPLQFHNTKLGADSGLIGAVELLFEA